MTKDYTLIAILIDRSGSMASIKDATIEGFNSFLRKQKEIKGKATVSLYQFDDVYETVYENYDIKYAPFLNNDTFQPRNSTALIDAMGRTIDELGEKLAKMEEKYRPEYVLLIIVSDGLENSSQKYTVNEVFNKIKHQQEKYNWKFIYLGANQDAIAQAARFGIDKSSSFTYDASKIGVSKMYRATSNYVTSLRTYGTASFTEDDRKEQENLINSK